jgi:seryl-tRNA synthetase
VTAVALTAELYEAIVKIVDDRVREIKVTREDFDRLTRTVAELSSAVGRLEGSIEKLTEAQTRTEERLEAFAEAQKRTEERLEALAEAQRRTEERLEALAEAQRRTEEAVGRLAVAVGGLSDTVGYGLEDVAKVMLPPWLERHERVRVEELERRFIEVEGGSVEVNLYGEGVKARASITIIGEAKSRIHVGDVKEFAGKVEIVQKALGGRRILPVMFGYWIHPSATSLGKAKGIRLVASYQR